MSTADELRETAAEMRATGDSRTAMLLERAAREIEHLNQLVNAYKAMIR